ncbi:CHAT domain-containing protein [Pholiota molesta]|nr:CHAT domain-containing protein [Pholiota molesta]
MFTAKLGELAERPESLNAFGDLFLQQYDETSSEEDINRAILAYKLAAVLTPSDNANFAMYVSDVGNSVLTRFELSGRLEDVNEAISMTEVAITYTPEGHASMASRLNNLGSSFQRRFERNGDLADIASAISVTQRAVELTPEGHADMPVWLNTLGISFETRFECIGDLADIASAISTQQRAIELTPEGHADMPSRLNNLGNAFQARFERNGDLADIASAISTQQRAVELTPEGHADMPAWLNNLGTSFQTRFERNGDLADIASAISTKQRAVELTPEGHADMPAWLNNLGISFETRFERNGDLADIASAISVTQRAVELTPEGHADLAARLNNLGNAFQARFERNGDPADIASAISAQQRAVDLTPEGHASMPSRFSSLGTSFLARFERNGDLTDIASAISTQQRAVELTPDGHAGMPAWLNNLGNSFQRRFERNGDLADIASAISVTQRAVELTPEGHADMPSRLNNLGNAFQVRFERNGDLADIASAISTQQRAVELTPEGHADMPTLLNNLGLSFQSRFEHNGVLADIASAISTQQRAVELTPEGHADMPIWLNNLGNSTDRRFRTTHIIQHMYQAISYFSQSATQVIGDPSVRLSAARKWALLSRQAADRPQSLRAFSVAIHLLPQVAGFEHTISKRHQTLVKVSDITASATAAAIDDNQLEMAVSWLEQGRCLVWNQLAHLRTPIDDLHAYYPSLAARFLCVARALELSGSRQEQHTIFSKENAAQMIFLQEKANTHTRLAKEWDKLLQEIRSIRKFEDFLLPPQLSKLLSRLPLDGPIIIFNIDESRCDALALKSGHDSPIHIPLDSFSLGNAIQLRDEIHKNLSDHRLCQRQEVDRDGDRLHAGGDTSMHKVLHDLWEYVAKPILDALGYWPNDSDPPRIWWCPTGPLVFLPIHAAGIYSNETGTAGPCVSDYVVSSYTPTVSALLDKIKDAPNMDDKPMNLLIVSQPSTPGLNPIPGAEREAYSIKDMVDPSLLLENASATVRKVKEEMKSHRWVHFACHAIQDEDEPLQSGVQLHDGRLELSEMMKQTLPDAELAFLSACQTSTGNQDLSDEVVHLAAGMLAAGYRSVVGTMWSIKDVYGPEIAKDFYLNILGTNSEARRRLDSGKAAGALHQATQNLRKKIGDTEEALLIWVPYVHFGF